jgi:hypothetical protein
MYNTASVGARHVHRAALAAALAIIAPDPAAAAAQAPRPAEVDVQTIGPQVGDRVPDFSLPDQSGRTRTLASIMGPKGAMLVFNRSADW